MRTTSISNGDNIIGSRDVIARLAELTSDREDAVQKVKDARERLVELGAEDALTPAEVEEQEQLTTLVESVWTTKDGTEATDGWDEDSEDEYQALFKLDEEGSSETSEWRSGEALIRDSYFEQYAQELAEDIGAIGKDTQWPLSYIDWTAASEALQQDYSQVDFDGVTYWIQSC